MKAYWFTGQENWRDIANRALPIIKGYFDLLRNLGLAVAILSAAKISNNPIIFVIALCSGVALNVYCMSYILPVLDKIPAKWWGWVRALIFVLGLALILYVVNELVQLVAYALVQSKSFC